jgi:decaprenyl-phosphate phosphoribosyltransferase
MAVLITARPRQWIKNALVIAAAGAAGALGNDDVPGRVAFACVGFCLMSAGIYALNDSRDVHEDRHHPRKRRRPVAAGELPVRDAVVLGLAWILLGLALCFAIRPLLGLVGVAYVALTLSYTYVWRHIIVLDIFAVAGGFVLRALAGGVAAPVTLSRWFVLVVSSAALFLAAGKRHAELVRVSRDAGDERPGGSTTGTRRVLSGYTPGGLRLVLGGSAGCALFAYCVWAFGLVDVDGVPWRLLTVVPFTICLLRYGALVGAGAGEEPEELLLGDRTLVLSAIAWLFLFALSVHAAAG